jgi:FHA domain
MSVLAFIDILDGDHVRHSVPVAAGLDGSARLRIGRKLDSDLVIDDPHVAPEHALLQLDAAPVGKLTLLPSLNGAVQGHRHAKAGELLQWPADSLLQLGHTRLRLRHIAAPLAPERPALLTVAPRWLSVVVLAMAALVLQFWDTWVAQSPGADWQVYLVPVLGVGAAVAGWAALWALLTQLFQRRFPFMLHLRRVLLVYVMLGLALTLLPALGFIGSAPWLQVPVTLMPVLGSMGLVYWHAHEVWPRARVALLLLLIVSACLWLIMGWSRQDSQQYRWRPPYQATLLPPSLRAAPLHSVDDLLKDAAALRSVLQEKAKLDPEGNPVDDDDE